MTINNTTVTFTYPEVMPAIVIKDTAWPRVVPVLDRPGGDLHIGVAYIENSGEGVLRVHAPEHWRHIVGGRGQVSLGYDSMPEKWSVDAAGDLQLADDHDAIVARVMSGMNVERVERLIASGGWRGDTGVDWHSLLFPGAR